MMYPWITECNKKNGKKMSYNRLALSPGNGIRNEGQNGVWCVCVVVVGAGGVAREKRWNVLVRCVYSL